MKISINPIFYATLSFAFIVNSACGKKIESNSGSSEILSFQSNNLKGNNFGLNSNEVVLTLDDGPSQYTLPMAKFLRAQDVPATYFLNFQNDSTASNAFALNQNAGRAAVKAVCEMKFHNIGSHRDHHDSNLAGHNSWSDLAKTHNALLDLCPDEDYFFYRAPGGNFKSGQAAPLNASTDSRGENVGNQYIGPVHWDYACDTEAGCQTNDWKTLRNNYYNLIVRGGVCHGGIVLAHDVGWHKSTIQALVGQNDVSNLSENTDGSQGLIAMLKKAGCSFVSLDKNSAAIQKLLGRAPAYSSAAN